MINFREKGGLIRRGLNITRGPGWIVFIWRWKDTVYRMRLKWFVYTGKLKEQATPEEIIVPRTENRSDMPMNWKRK